MITRESASRLPRESGGQEGWQDPYKKTSRLNPIDKGLDHGAYCGVNPGLINLTDWLEALPQIQS